MPAHAGRRGERSSVWWWRRRLKVKSIRNGRGRALIRTRCLSTPRFSYRSMRPFA